uniref:Uncharacterized protein n=1 Tax=Oncorhynchus kisutch TaxID=8019 RepID=A0A8C7H9Z3_ONCKI
IWVPLLLGSPRAPMTFPRASRPLLIWMLSFSLSPVFPVRRILSDPPPRRWSMCTLKMVCERLEWGFIWVAPVCLAVLPDSSRLSTSSSPSTSHSFTPHSTAGKRTNMSTDRAMNN